MQRLLSRLVLGVFCAAPLLVAQITPSATDIPAPQQPDHRGNLIGYQNPNRKGGIPPFSRIGVSGGVSTMGVSAQIAVNATKNLNIRGIGTVFAYNVNNITVNGSGGANGIAINGNLNFATGGVALDYYPWSRHGLRLSPGMQFYNQNLIMANGTASPGSSFSLGSQKYYSDAVNPLTIVASLGLNRNQLLPTATIGWGNLISRTGGHWSFPVELGIVYTGVPELGMTLSGNACLTSSDAATNGSTCVNMATNATAQQNLSAQIIKYRNSLNPYPFYPIVSFGVGYSFGFR